jgi:hypothetical protein
MTLEDLAAIGVVENNRQDEDDDGEDHYSSVEWRLAGYDGEIIAGVFEALDSSRRGWDETWVYISTPPPIREEEEEQE